MEEITFGDRLRFMIAVRHVRINDIAKQLGFHNAGISMIAKNLFAATPLLEAKLRQILNWPISCDAMIDAILTAEYEAAATTTADSAAQPEPEPRAVEPIPVLEPSPAAEPDFDPTPAPKRGRPRKIVRERRAYDDDDDGGGRFSSGAIHGRVLG